MYAWGTLVTLIRGGRQAGVHRGLRAARSTGAVARRDIHCSEVSSKRSRTLDAAERAQQSLNESILRPAPADRIVRRLFCWRQSVMSTKTCWKIRQFARVSFIL